MPLGTNQLKPEPNAVSWVYDPVGNLIQVLPQGTIRVQLSSLGEARGMKHIEVLKWYKAHVAA